jgi:uncharacterized protein (TIGR03545 family)
MSESEPPPVTRPGDPGTVRGDDHTVGEGRQKARILRPPGLAVFLAFCLLLGLAWYLYADRLVEQSVEATGASVVGARVDVGAADVRPADGSVRLTDLAVTNPNAPMTNLFEAEEILVDLLLEPLLTKKVVIQEMVVAGVRFNTPREESGELENPDPEAGRLLREIDTWASQVEVPPLSLEGLSTVVRTDAISTDSLRTVQQARILVQDADSMRSAWESRLDLLDPRPRIDSLQAVVTRLEGFQLSPLNAIQVPGLIRDGRAALDRLLGLRTEIEDLSQDVQGGVQALRSGVEEIPTLRAADLAYARGLLNLPSLEGPDLSPAIFGGTALTWMKPVLYWAQTAERYLPPGLNPRNRPGPRRARAEGTTVAFPGRATYPSFLLQEGQLSLEIGGEGPAAGVYAAELRNFASQPTLVGQPMELVARRGAAAQGPAGLSVAAVLDHTSELLRDSVALRLDGIELPAFDLEALDARLELGLGDASFDLLRVGSEIDARLHWSSDNVGWFLTDTGDDGASTLERQTLAESLGALSSGNLQVGTAAWARNLLWRTVSGLGQVELTMGLSGSIERPSLSVRSNIGSAVAESLRQELGREIEAAEARLRQEVEARIQPVVQEARGRLDAAQAEVLERVDSQRAEIEALQARLEERIDALVPGD